MNGRIRDEDIDEVRERADLVEIVSTHVQLKKAGRVFKGLCPFHHEKTPSFIVDPDKQLYHCFGCQRGGNVYNFLMETENLDFPEAVKAVAKRIGYNLRFEPVTGEKKVLLDRQTRLYNLNQLAREFYQNNLVTTAEGKKALAYLKGRGYGDDTIAAFALGYAPSGWQFLTNYCLKKGYKKEELLQSGLVASSEKRPGEFYDRFRGRVVFPILDLQGRTVGFGGRVLGDEMPKYLNSPETAIYHKGKTLYALNWAKPHIISSGQAILVEGYTDVISLHQAGFDNAVATLGTALTADHLRLLSRFATKATLMFDADVAGELAAERGLAFVPDFYLSREYAAVLDLTDKRHLDIEVVVLPKGSDPADFVAKSGPEQFRKLIEGATPMVDFAIAQALKAHNLKTIEGRRKAAAVVIDIIWPLPSAVAQEDYLKQAAEQIGVSYDSIFLEARRRTAQATKPAGGRAEPAATGRRDPAQRVEEEALKAILQLGEAAEGLIEGLTVEDFTVAENQTLFLVVKEGIEKTGRIDAKDLVARVEDPELKRTATRLSVSPVVAEDASKYAKEILHHIKEFGLKRRISVLKGEMQSINPEKEPARYDSLFKELLALEAARRELR